tara:strand:+ start:193 stop:543 length:351 start_codon:yes stop_codon:yes gene_type:complete
MSLAFTDWIIEEQEKDERLDLKEHTKILFKGRNWKIPEDAFCTKCNDFATDCHHYRSRKSGGNKNMDYYENLIPLCRLCHDIAGVDKEFNHLVYIKNLENIVEHEKEKYANGDHSQ